MHEFIEKLSIGVKTSRRTRSQELDAVSHWTSMLKKVIFISSGILPIRSLLKFLLRSVGDSL